MKYQRLTKEQFLALHEDFSQFLASQKIDKTLWDRYKSTNDSIVDEQLDLFSDIVWHEILSKTCYLLHLSDTHINLFRTNEDTINRIVIESAGAQFTTESSINLQEWLTQKETQVFKGTKKYSKSKEVDTFELIQMGAVLTNSHDFEHIWNQL